jgi:hypothetical protein
MSPPLRCLIASLAALAASLPASAADAFDAKATVAPLVHRSAFATYRNFPDAPPIPWKQANDTVGQIGGWRAYAREAAQPEAPEPTPTPAPLPNHRRHGKP